MRWREGVVGDREKRWKDKGRNYVGERRLQWEEDVGMTGQEEVEVLPQWPRRVTWKRQRSIDR